MNTNARMLSKSMKMHTMFSRMTRRTFAAVALGLVWLGSIDSLRATTFNVIGSYANWPTNWVPVNALNDPDDGLANVQLDFVGDANNPGAYYASNSEYVFFRQRVDLDTVSALSVFHDAHLVLIDLVGQDYNTTTKTLQPGSDGYPDYGFAWDSKSNDSTKHGLEMVVRSTSATYWNGINMDDIDYNAAKKLANDINGDGRTTDGYIRVIDQQATTAFGNTTFVDFAVKWSYLQTYTGLTSNQVWRVAFGSIANATDHNNITADVSGGASPSSLSTSGWVQQYSGSDAFLGNRVWNDTDQDGIQDVGETGMTNVAVKLYSVAGATTNLVASTTTDASGNYSLQAAPGNYVLRVDAPDGYAFSPKQASGGTAETDSDFGTNHPYSELLTIFSGDYLLNLDAGLYYAPTLSVITSFRAYAEGGRVIVAWETAAEYDTIGYWIDHLEDGTWVRLNPEEPVWSEMTGRPAAYTLPDPGTAPGGTYTWRIVEIEDGGAENVYGPYTVTVDGAAADFDAWVAGVAWDGAVAGRDDDPDGDGLSNFEEFLARTDPLNANSVLKITGIRPVANGIEIRWASVAGRAYAVEHTATLGGAWLPVKSGLVAEGTESRFTLPGADGGFFRVVVKED